MGNGVADGAQPHPLEVFLKGRSVSISQRSRENPYLDRPGNGTLQHRHKTHAVISYDTDKGGVSLEEHHSVEQIPKRTTLAHLQLGVKVEGRALLIGIVVKFGGNSGPLLLAASFVCDRDHRSHCVGFSVSCVMLSHFSRWPSSSNLSD